MVRKTKSKPKRGTSNPNSVPQSRAGDVFHYRWAARRCLRLLDFNSHLDYITIESSKEPNLLGESVIDMAEYSSDESNQKSVEYFQLKHSTTRCNKAFTLSDLKKTIEEFANRFRDLQKQKNDFTSITFTVITNRLISSNFKESIRKLAIGKSGGKSFDNTIKSYTKLEGENLTDFCNRLKLVDDEGDYDAQKHVLGRKLSRLTCEPDAVNKQLLNLVELVRKRIEPKSKRKDINKDDVLECFGFTSEKDLFPAPPFFEDLPTVIEREQNDRIYQAIIDSEATFTIITAEGGTGKSITCTQLVSRFSNGSLGIAYDCFGNGGYRKLSEHRHRACDAYVQIANELAQKGLCERMLPVMRDQDDRLTQAFLQRLSEAIRILRESDKNALLVILFDAVDNAEIAAAEFGDKCFASYLLRETLPEGCRIVYFSRPERIHLFNPPAAIPQINIELFSDRESLQHLQSIYSDASPEHAVEFCRLTGGNPRVQANALALTYKSTEEILAYLGPGGKTVDDLIDEQLRNAIIGIQELYPVAFNQYVKDICTGLASLPPFIPVDVLASVSGVDASTVKSFITDLGRPLWLTDRYVQFRDEPTESWFRATYTATSEQIKTYISRLEPLATDFFYVAEALPSLLLKSGQYKELIELALSEEKLPIDNPVEARSIQVYRLQFAFKAALKNKQYVDAFKLALRAGEEVAGNDRQLKILSENIDLTTKFLPEQRVMALAYQRSMRGTWSGSETIYSAALLSSIAECEGEARSYLRSGRHWLTRFFEERDKEEERINNNGKLENNDVLAMLFCYCQLDGEKAAVDFIRPSNHDGFIYSIVREFSARIVDKGAFEILERMATHGKDCSSLVIAITHELMRVGRTPDKEILTYTLDKIVGPEKWLEKPNDISDSNHISSSAYLSFFEACVIEKLPPTHIGRALNYYINDPRISLMDRDYDCDKREN